ncbi:hypothetical protein EEB18_008915 [Sphingopyxis sp. OPL5]|uniref:hypothetical protein n=1 Tax=Sphingopyxis sp. OPL5 TaxID=2486273 RepID=UPI00164E3C68|nr:hypothetical protein [Sphingopyxis sp. OPL5]QNO29033.1 hypothetical protein EEB18_008915 [Sphingopyxis sp. OPL5]
MTRMRSPNYPAIPLGQAVDYVDKIFKSDRTNIIDKAVAAEHMGFSGLNGRTLKLLGALSQYGLLDKVGKGKVRVSKTAVSVLHGIDDAEKGAAISAAAASPGLFRRIRESFDAPSDKTITSFLMKEGFTDAAVGPVLKSYSETNAYLAANGVSESYGEAPADASDSNHEDDEVLEDEDDDVIEVEDPPTGEGKAKQKPAPRNEIALNSTKPIFDFETVRIETVIDNPDDLAELIQRLEQIKSMLPAKKYDL